MARTYIDTSDRHSPFYRRVRRELTSAGIEIVESPLEATATFSVVSDLTGQRVLSVSARNVPTEFEVYYTVAYGVVTESETLLETRSQTRSRDYTWDETRVLGKEREEELLREALVDDIVRVVMIQLSGI
jgi:LPS-assembly lipoprotein